MEMALGLAGAGAELVVELAGAELAGLGPISAKKHPAPGVALAVLLKTFLTIQPGLLFNLSCMIS